MQVTVTMKRGDPKGQFASSGVTVTLSPADVGLKEPDSVETMRAAVNHLMYEGKLHVCGQLVREGLMTEDEFRMQLAPWAQVDK